MVNNANTVINKTIIHNHNPRMKRWTAQEDAELREIRNQFTVEELATHFNRTVGSITCRLWQYDNPNYIRPRKEEAEVVINNEPMVVKRQLITIDVTGQSLSKILALAMYLQESKVNFKVN